MGKFLCGSFVPIVLANFPHCSGNGTTFLPPPYPPSEMSADTVRSEQKERLCGFMLHEYDFSISIRGVYT